MPGIGVFNKPPLEIESAKTASFTAAAGYIYPVTLTSVTADLAVTFPSSPATDDAFGFYVAAAHSTGGTSSFSVRPFFCVEPANTTSINGSSYAALSGDGGGEYSLWVNSESLIFVYDGSTWRMFKHNDGRIPHQCKAYLSTAQTVATSTPDQIDFDTEEFDIVNMHDGAGVFDIKRVNSYYNADLSIEWSSDSTGARRLYIERSTGANISRETKAANATSDSSISGNFTTSSVITVNAKVEQYSAGNLDLTANTTHLSIMEQL